MDGRLSWPITVRKQCAQDRYVTAVTVVVAAQAVTPHSAVVCICLRAPLLLEFVLFGVKTPSLLRKYLGQVRGQDHGNTNIPHALHCASRRVALRVM